jgi:hypothetical protein
MMSLGSVRGVFSAIQFGELLTTHWIRVGLLTGYAILIFCMAAKSWTKPMEPEERSPAATSGQQ